jgi:hypothetical protein
MVCPPRVVSKAKSSLSRIARSRSLFPSNHAALLASSSVIPGFLSRMAREASSGLK